MFHVRLAVKALGRRDAGIDVGKNVRSKSSLSPDARMSWQYFTMPPMGGGAGPTSRTLSFSDRQGTHHSLKCG